MTQNTFKAKIKTNVVRLIASEASHVVNPIQKKVWIFV